MSAFLSEVTGSACSTGYSHAVGGGGVDGTPELLFIYNIKGALGTAWHFTAVGMLVIRIMLHLEDNFGA